MSEIYRYQGTLINFFFCLEYLKYFLFLFKGAVHFKIVKYERIKFLVIALRESIEIYAWAPKPYHKFMAFKSFSELQHRPLLVDLTVEEGTRLKVLYGSASGFHAVDLDSASVYDIYLPKHAQVI
jgi:hypothetical protein